MYVSRTIANARGGCFLSRATAHRGGIGQRNSPLCARPRRTPMGEIRHEQRRNGRILASGSDRSPCQCASDWRPDSAGHKKTQIREGAHRNREDSSTGPLPRAASCGAALVFARFPAAGCRRFLGGHIIARRYAQGQRDSHFPKISNWVPFANHALPAGDRYRLIPIPGK